MYVRKKSYFPKLSNAAMLDWNSLFSPALFEGTIYPKVEIHNQADGNKNRL